MIRNPRVVIDHYEYAGLEYKGGGQKQTECPNWDELYVGHLVQLTVCTSAVHRPLPSARGWPSRDSLKWHRLLHASTAPPAPRRACPEATVARRPALVFPQLTAQPPSTHPPRAAGCCREKDKILAGRQERRGRPEKQASARPAPLPLRFPGTAHKLVGHREPAVHHDKDLKL